MIQYGSSNTPRNTNEEQSSNATRKSLIQPKNQPPPEKLKVPSKDLLVFFRQLSVILESGVALAQGMILIAENMTNTKLAYCVQSIAFRLNAGEELSSSLRQYPKVFEPIAIGLIEENRWNRFWIESRFWETRQIEVSHRALIYPVLV